MNEVHDILLISIEDSLHQDLKGRVLGLEIVDILLVDALSSMVCMWSIFAFSQIDRSAGSALWQVSIAL